MFSCSVAQMVCILCSWIACFCLRRYWVLSACFSAMSSQALGETYRKKNVLINLRI